ncbi:MAG: hypothetical protein JWM76_4549 [Pseudonocardiales bacterium]|nr:hypothetical protein [Pseudonocardiales bacterium]
MTDWVSEPPLAPAPPKEPWATIRDLRFAGMVIAVFVVAGVAAGALWSAISSTTQAYVQSATVMIPGESEGFVSADGRYLIITAAIGLVMGSAVWAFRDYRGPVAAGALGVGGFLGALIAAVVGHLFSSGKNTGAVNTVIDLKISLHGRGLVAIEPVVALLVYLIGTLFVSSDDLNRSAATRRDVQSLEGDWNGPGGAQDGQLPAQQGDFGR